MIASYPRFSKLNFSHREFIYDFTAKFEPYADFNFICLYAWDFVEKAEISLLNDNLVIRVPDYITSKPMLSVLGKKKIPETLQILYERNDAEIKLVPETVIKLARKNDLYSWVEDEDNHDYIFDLQAQAELKGGQLKRQRQKSNKFARSYGDRVETREAKLDDQKHIREIMGVVHTWVNEISKDKKNAQVEEQAIARLLQKASALNIVCYEILLDGNLVGFSINEILGNNYALCHFQKTDTRYTNIDVFFISYIASQLVERGCLYVNWEQDMGIDGLRQVKKSWKPVKTLKKYTIIPKN